jgi:hypothetical protein
VKAIIENASEMDKKILRSRIGFVNKVRSLLGSTIPYEKLLKTLGSTQLWVRRRITRGQRNFVVGRIEFSKRGQKMWNVWVRENIQTPPLIVYKSEEDAWGPLDYPASMEEEADLIYNNLKYNLAKISSTEELATSFIEAAFNLLKKPEYPMITFLRLLGFKGPQNLEKFLPSFIKNIEKEIPDLDLTNLSREDFLRINQIFHDSVPDYCEFVLQISTKNAKKKANKQQSEQSLMEESDNSDPTLEFEERGDSSWSKSFQKAKAFLKNM